MRALTTAVLVASTLLLLGVPARAADIAEDHDAAAVEAVAGLSIGSLVWTVSGVFALVCGWVMTRHRASVRAEVGPVAEGAA